MTPTERLLHFAAAPHSIAGPAREAALRLLADTLAVGAAGSTAPGADGVYAAAHGWGDGGAVPLLGRRGRLPATSAAFVNAFQIHCLEWDAVHEGAVVHAMSVVTAALHAVCSRAGSVDPEDALAALAVGVDIACGLGLAATGPLRFFRPATAGLLGAALACARVAGIPPERFADVLGLAYSAAAGTMQAHVEGSIALPLQIAGAAAAAVRAVDLVSAGLTGPHDVLDGPFGYFALFETGSGAGYVPDSAHWLITDLSIKSWPCGRASHATLGTLSEMPRSISSIEAYVPPLVARLVDRPWTDDMTPAYARLCLPFLTALMLADGQIDPRRFTAASFVDPVLQALGQRLTITVDSNRDPNALSPQRFTVMLADGSRVEHHVPATPGHPDNSLTPALAAAKLTLAASLATAPADPLAFLAGTLA